MEAWKWLVVAAVVVVGVLGAFDRQDSWGNFKGERANPLVVVGVLLAAAVLGAGFYLLVIGF